MTLVPKKQKLFDFSNPVFSKAFSKPVFRKASPVFSKNWVCSQFLLVLQRNIKCVSRIIIFHV